MFKFEKKMAMLNGKTIDFKTLLEYGRNFRQNQIKYIEIFLKYHRIDQIDVHRNTLLHFALRNKFTILFDYLLKQHTPTAINVNAKNKYGNTVLYYVIVRPTNIDEEHIKLLLTIDSIDIHCITTGKIKSALELAIKYRNTLIIKLLIKCCATKINKIKIQLIHHAIVNRLESNAIALMLPFVDDIDGVDENNCTILYGALRTKNYKLLPALFKNGVNVNAKNINKSTALHLALKSKCRLEIILKLLAEGADCNLSSATNTTLNYGIEYNNIDVVKLIVDRLDENVIRNGVNLLGDSALHTAVKMKNEAVIELMLANNVNLNLQNLYKFTALHLALQRRDLNKRVIFALIDAGIDCNLPSKYDTTLNYAIMYNDVEVIKVILSKLDREYITQSNGVGSTAVHTALRVNNLQVINLIINNEFIDLNEMEKEYSKPLEEACYIRQYNDRYMNPNVLELMLPHYNRNGPQIGNALINFLNKYKSPTEQHSVFLTMFLKVFDLLLFEGKLHVTLDIMEFEMTKPVFQLLLLSLVNRNQLVYEATRNAFYYSNNHIDREDYHLITENNTTANWILRNFNEILKMREREISPTHRTTYFQVLCMDQYEIAKLLRSQEIRSSLGHFNYITEFPHYWETIYNRYKSGNDLRCKKVIFTNYLVNAPPIKGLAIKDDIEKIFTKLCKYDIENFIAAGRGWSGNGRRTVN